MKRIFIICGLFLSIASFSQKVYVDSLDFALIVANDTVVYPNIGRLPAGAVISLELDYTALNNDNAYFAPGFSNKGNTFNFAGTTFGATTDSVKLDTAAYDRIVNGLSTSSIYSKVSTKQSTQMWCGERNYGKFFGLYFRKGSVTAGKVYWYIMKL